MGLLYVPLMLPKILLPNLITRTPLGLLIRVSSVFSNKINNRRSCTQYGPPCKMKSKVGVTTVAEQIEHQLHHTSGI